jgi:hypothetical protein
MNPIMNPLFRLCLFLIPIFALVGCTPASPTIQPTQGIQLPSPIILPATVTAVSTPTFTSTPQVTVSAVPALSEESARIHLLDLLKDNGGCHLPCLWGITPGKSNYQDARNILIPLNSISTAETTYLDPSPLNGVLLGTISPLYIEGEQRLNSWVSYLYDDNNIVNNIGFRVLEEQVITDTNGNLIGKQPVFDSSTFIKRIEYYSLSHVLSEQGMPSSVMIEASGLTGYPVVAAGIDIALLYPDQGIWVNYTMPMYNQDGIKMGCPANAYIKMELYPPGNPETFYSFLDKTDWGVTKKGYKPLEEVTPMSVEQFYQIFRNPTDKCVETPEGIWPTPEAGGG